MSEQRPPVLMEKPWAAFRLGEAVFRETAFGIVKRLRVLRGWIEAERAAKGLSVKEFRVLDVGCGTGVNVTIPLAEMGYDVVGVDTDGPSIERGRRIAEGLAPVCLRQGRLADAVPEAGFHAVVCSEVLEHLEHPEELLGEIVSRTAPSGLVVVTVPNGYGYFEIESMVSGLLPWLPKLADRLQHGWVRRLGSPELRARHEAEWRPAHYELAWSTLAAAQRHCRRFTPAGLLRMVTGRGLRVVEMRNCTFLAGNALNALIRDWDRLLAWNGEAADRLPHWMCSAWLLAARREEG